MKQQSMINKILPWVIWGIATTLFFVQYMVRVSPNSMQADLMHSFNITSSDYGKLTAYFLYAYVAMQIPVGVLIDKYGPKRLLTIFCALGAICVYAFSKTNDIAIAQLSRLIFGLCCSFTFVSALKLAHLWFSPKKFSILVGTTQAIGMVGGVAGVVLMGKLVKYFGWRPTLFNFSIILALFPIAIFLLVKDSPQKAKSNQPSKTKQLPLLDGLKIILTCKDTWLVAFCAGFLYLPMGVLAESWGTFYLEMAKNISRDDANSIVGIIFIGWAIGGPLAGMLSNKIGRTGVMKLAAISGVIVIAMVLYVKMNVISLYILFFIFGLFNSGLIACYTTAGELHPANISGVALGFANGMSVVVAALCQQLYGKILDIERASRDATGSIDYIASDFTLPMLIILAGCVLGFMFSLFTRETFTK